MRFVDIKSFDKLMLDAGRDLEEAARDFRDRVGMGLLEGVVFETPVDTGRARANWQVTVEQPAVGEVEGVDKLGNETFERGADEIQEAPLDSIIWLTNNVEYIEALEEGHSWQKAPDGMVAITLAQLQSELG